MKRVLFITNYAAPYKVQFYDELSRYFDVTVVFSDKIEDQKHRTSEWFTKGNGGFHSVQLTRCVGTLKGENICIDVMEWIRKPWDVIVICGYASPTMMIAMAYLRMKRIPFWLEVDGGLVRQDSAAAYAVKRMLVGSASAYLSSGKATTDYLVHYGAKRETVREYPFSSLFERDILKIPVSEAEKKELKQELGLKDGKTILSIGQFIHRKGFDVLLQAAASLDAGADVYIVGGQPPEEYLSMCSDLGLGNVHFLGFMKKDKLVKYYQAADLFVLPTREDIWGLVVNEAMAFGLPVVTTDRCVAGLELVENGVTGYIVPVGDAQKLADRINDALSGDLYKMGAAALEKVRPYTIENMAGIHAEILDQEI